MDGRALDVDNLVVYTTPIFCVYPGNVGGMVSALSATGNTTNGSSVGSTKADSAASDATGMNTQSAAAAGITASFPPHTNPSLNATDYRYKRLMYYYLCSGLPLCEALLEGTRTEVRVITCLFSSGKTCIRPCISHVPVYMRDAEFH